MYSFAQRKDTKVIDEPLYGHYLLVTGVKHPGREEIMNEVNCDGNLVMDNLVKLSDLNGKKVLFLKQMTKHLVDIDCYFLSKFKNILLIRNPGDMLPSLAENITHPNLADTGLDLQWHLYKSLENMGNNPIVIDADELLKDPKDILKQLCRHLKLKFFDSMLSWPAKPREEDGIWAKYWYQSLHKSTGFLPYRPKSNFPVELEKLLTECTPYYEKLLTKSIRTSGEKL
jgi:hypothetical protein